MGRRGQGPLKIGEEVEAIGIDGLPAGYVKVQVIARKEGLSVYISDPKKNPPNSRVGAEGRGGGDVPWYNIGNVRTWNAGIYKKVEYTSQMTTVRRPLNIANPFRPRQDRQALGRYLTPPYNNWG